MSGDHALHEHQVRKEEKFPLQRTIAMLGDARSSTFTKPTICLGRFSKSHC